LINSVELLIECLCYLPAPGCAQGEGQHQQDDAAKATHSSRALTLKPFIQLKKKTNFFSSSMWFGLASLSGENGDNIMAFSLFNYSMERKEREMLNFFWSAGLPYAEEDKDRNNADVF
jgi:hypothetical protein